MKSSSLFLLFIIMSYVSLAQKSDTILIDASKVNPEVLRPGVHQYLVYFRNGQDSSRTNFQFWTREVQHVTHRNRKAIKITQTWEDSKAVTHKVTSICDRKDFLPLYHDSWWNARGSSTFDFVEKTMSINGTPVNEADTARRSKAIYSAYKKALDQYVLNWHLDLEVFPILPYREGVTFVINFYDPGFPAPSLQLYTVTGSASIRGYNDQPVDCWLLTHVTKGSSETFYISKNTREVLKLEQQFGNRFRYKVKVAFAAP